MNDRGIMVAGRSVGPSHRDGGGQAEKAFASSVIPGQLRGQPASGVDATAQRQKITLRDQPPDAAAWDACRDQLG